MAQGSGAPKKPGVALSNVEARTRQAVRIGRRARRQIDRESIEQQTAQLDAAANAIEVSSALGQLAQPVEVPPPLAPQPLNHGLAEPSPLIEPAREPYRPDSQPLSEPVPLWRAAPGQGLYGRSAYLPLWRRIAGRAFALAAVAAGLNYLIWRLGTVGPAGVPGVIFWIVEAINVFALVTLVPLLWRYRVRPQQTAPPTGTLDIYIPVCGEPIAMVEQTLKAALDIEYPHRTYLLNDGCIAGKRNWQAVERLAAKYGVTCFSRTDGLRGKAGNLNYALPRTDGEFVCVIDADHLADPSLAKQTLGYFRESDIGFVCTPQQFVDPVGDPLNNRELFFYRVLQPAKDATNSAFSCGNGSVYRRSAVASIGGFSEWSIVEDLHSSLQMHAKGWKSVYHPHAITAGTAPATAAALAKQRLGWATDSLRILFWDSPLRKRGLTLWQRLFYLHTTLFYLMAATQVVFLTGPPLYLLMDVKVMHFESVDAYLAHSIPFLVAIGFFLAVHVGVVHAMRTAAQQLFLSPVYLLALFRALPRNRKAAGSVTPKRGQESFSKMLVPSYVAVFAAAAGAAVAVIARAPHLTLAGVWACLFVFCLATHVGTIGRGWIDLVFRSGLRIAAVLALAVIVVAPGSQIDVQAGAPNPAPMQHVLPPATGVYLGVYNQDALMDPAALQSWGERTNFSPSIVGSYQHWLGEDRDFRADRSGMIASAGAVPMITWEPWRKPAGKMYAANQPDVRLSAIVAGRYDAYIERWAQSAATYKRPIMLRFMHEMNGDWYPWSIFANGNTAKDYRQAWRHVHGLFERAGAHNVSWVWAVNSFTGLGDEARSIRSAYPGDRYVDWVSTTGFNWGNSHNWNTWRDFDGVFHATYKSLSRFEKPIMISEIGTVPNGGSSSAWIEQAERTVRESYPNIKAMVWFDSRYSDDVDFRLRSAERRAFGSAFGGSRYRARPIIVEASISDV